MLEALLDSTFLGSLPRFIAPILLAALGGALCERAGVFNIALEGFVLMGAFAAVLGAYWSGTPWGGAILAVFVGIAMGLLFAEFHLRRPGDPIVVSIALNLLAAGLTTYLLRALFGVSGVFQDPAIAGFERLRLPFLEPIPLLGSLLSDQSPLVWIALLAVPLLHLLLVRHRFGLRLRAAGENSASLVAGGVHPAHIRTLALVFCGALCGLAGAQLSISNVSLFVENMSAGRGWIAVVAVLLTRGRPWPLLGVVVIFGAVDSLSFRIQGFGWPQQFTEMMPYLATLFVLVAISWRRRRTSGLNP